MNKLIIAGRKACRDFQPFAQLIDSVAKVGDLSRKLKVERIVDAHPVDLATKVIQSIRLCRPEDKVIIAVSPFEDMEMGPTIFERIAKLFDSRKRKLLPSIFIGSAETLSNEKDVRAVRDSESLLKNVEDQTCGRLLSAPVFSLLGLRKPELAEWLTKIIALDCKTLAVAETSAPAHP